MGEIDWGGGEKGTGGESLSFSDDEGACSTRIWELELGTVGSGQRGGGLHGANGVGLCFFDLDIYKIHEFVS